MHKINVKFLTTMEQQFILKLPDALKDLDTNQATFKKLSSREVQLVYKNLIYPGIICKLPTILETQKNIENKLYKISDVSTIIVIYEDSNFDLNSEIMKIESNGLTPPMRFVKERKFKPALVKTVIADNRKVNELLKEDARAVKIEILNEENDSNEELDMFAAEIENELPDELSQTNGMDTDSLLSENSVKVVLKKETGKNEAKTSSKPIKVNVSKAPFSEILEKVILMEIEIKPQFSEPVRQQSLEMPTFEEPINEDILEIEKKIKEKEELLNKTLNPILKKRFEQAISVLKEEYEKKKKEIGK